MFLSRIAITHQRKPNPYQWHQKLWTLFDAPNDSRAFLFHLEQTSTKQSQLLLLSSQEAICQVPQIRVLQQKEVDYHLKSGQKLAFRLRANPIKTIKDERKRTNQKNEIKSCRVPLVREDEQIAWLTRKLGPAAKLQECFIQEKENLYFRKKNRAGKIAQVTFEGTLEIIDPDEFTQLILRGIGPAKAFGCGLLLIRRI
ncbi:MAG: type I-E CRISPR-associated protein Cas6/Cse3/CasE [gamma proteobacterium endosymbiont of Lamellibrachia anaximandri]|nr:type I-E CRISPR-associated protein Cas6/Cse3/CasE [gamma proteobacterium endosymbiont of Lamellibrachia anaximandri]MBL3619373.1 type I-E CRISPR-associated protein Cas6/Cse3/CasE [gamma proteobacterium endosymbiont of Lamellibrachia anaximandri]